MVLSISGSNRCGLYLSTRAHGHSLGWHLVRGLLYNRLYKCLCNQNICILFLVLGWSLMSYSWVKMPLESNVMWLKKKKKKDPTGIIRRTATGVTNSLDFRVKLPCANPDSSASWFCDIRPITQSPHISPIGEKSQQCLVVPWKGGVSKATLEA